MDAAVADAAKGVSLLALLLLAGCAGDARPSWFYKTANEAGSALPMAVWGPPLTTAYAGFFCRADGGMTFWLGADAALTDGRPVHFRVGRAEQPLVERFVEDGVGTAEFAMAADSPLLVAIRRGARRIELRLPGDRWRMLRLADPVRRLATDCG
jgi:hypothetical protein